MGQAIEKADHINVAVIQGNIGQSDKWEESFKNETLERYFNLTRAAALQKPEIMIWPETALPFYYPWDKNPTKRVDAFIAKTGISTIFGAPAFEPSGDKFNYFNRAFLMNAKGIITGTYDKVHLVPFGEYVPFGNILSFLGKLVAHAGDFSPGKKDIKPLRFNDTSAGILICFEIVFPSLSRSHVNNGAELLLTITNDAWFGTSSAPLQHFSFGVFRAVETRRALARSANTGISGFIYPSGKILKTTRLFETTFLIESLPKLNIKTLYSRLGDFFPMICLVAMISLFVVKRRVKQASS